MTQQDVSGDHPTQVGSQDEQPHSWGALNVHRLTGLVDHRRAMLGARGRFSSRMWRLRLSGRYGRFGVDTLGEIPWALGCTGGSSLICNQCSVRIRRNGLSNYPRLALLLLNGVVIGAVRTVIDRVGRLRRTAPAVCGQIVVRIWRRDGVRIRGRRPMFCDCGVVTLG